MNVGETYLECGTLRLTVNPQEDNGNLRRAAQRIRWLPGVLAVEGESGELEIQFRGSSDDCLRQIHRVLARTSE